MRVLGFGTYDSSRQPRAAVLLEGLRARGADVSELNLPLGFTTHERVDMLQRPHLVYRLLLRLALRWSMLAWRRARLRQEPDVVVVGFFAQFDVILARVLFPRTAIVMDMLVLSDDTARDRGIAAGARTRLLRWLDRVAARCADVVVVDTAENAALVPAPAGRIAVVPVGAGEAWFHAYDSTKRILAAEEALRVVFFGVFTPLQGTPVIGQALAALPPEVSVRVTMIGTGQDYEETRRIVGDDPRIEWVPWVDAAELPDVVAAHDVCLGIFGDSPKAFRVTPTKVYQGAAAGCAIVTSDTAPQRRALEEAAAFVPPGSALALTQLLADLANDPQRVARLARMARERAISAFEPARLVPPIIDALEKRS